ncbi:hypothetical protein AAGW05_12895 [Arthrobacter sp. LAPM80]|uniref:hypothetical protein n=1 Tax=Arthrobacter sp. LAPM80 TaxID=3141788 RepID=UPI00398B624F
MSTVKMESLDMLGSAAPDSAELRKMAAAALHEHSVDLVKSSAEEMAMPLFNMTTGGL